MEQQKRPERVTYRTYRKHRKNLNQQSIGIKRRYKNTTIAYRALEEKGSNQVEFFLLILKRKRLAI